MKQTQETTGANSVPLSHRGLFVICALFLALAWAYGLVLPAFENLDEIEHFAAIRYVAEVGSLPVHDPLLQERYHYRQEASQPPLYYMLMGGLVRFLRLPTEDANSYLVGNPFVACGPSDNPYNKHALYHNPAREGLALDGPGTLPWNGALLTLHILRVVAPLLQLATVIGVYAIARLVFPQRPEIPPLAAAVAAFNPQFLSLASGVNNDNLAVPLVTMGLYLTLVVHQRGLSFARSLGLGILAGLAGLSKLSGLLLLAFVGLVLLESIWRARRSPGPGLAHAVQKAARHTSLIGAVVALVCGWWFWRNWQLYGDPTALEPMLRLVGRREVLVFPLEESGLLFRSFWGQMACTFFSDRFYLFFTLLVAVGLLGLLSGAVVARRRGRQEHNSWSGILWLALWFGIVFLAWVRWDLLTPAPGGRLLFPAISSTSVLLAYGLLNVWPANWRRRVAPVGVVLLAAVALATLRWEIHPLFAPPPTYASEEAPPIASPLEATFASVSPSRAPQIALRGHATELTGGGSYLDVTFHWEALAPLSRDYALAIQLASPVPGDDTLRFNYNTFPGRGNYPTTAWPQGRVIADRYRFRLPESNAPTQAWQLLVAFYELESGERLPVYVGGQEAGKRLVLATLRVPGRPIDCPNEAVLAEPVYFGQQGAEQWVHMIALTGATVQPESDPGHPGLQVSLCWKSVAPTPTDYTVFVHLYGENGDLLATGDGPPAYGAFPTHLWQPGDPVVDTHVIPITDTRVLKGSGNRVGVGLYNLASGDRLQAVQSDQPIINNVYLIQP